MIEIVQKPSTENIDVSAIDFSVSYDCGTALLNEEFAYQIVLRSDSDRSGLYSVHRFAPVGVSFYLAQPVAVSWPHYPDADPKNYVIHKPDVVYDRLVPLKNGEKIYIGPVPTVLWVSLHAAYDGEVHCRFRFSSESETAESTFDLTVINCDASKEPVRYCEHIFPSSIAKAYGIPLFCDEYWRLLKLHLELAADHGVSEIFVPAYPTAYPSVSVEDPVQLIRVIKDGSKFKFNFDLFDCWVYYASECGIKHLLLPPLFPYLAEKRILPWLQLQYHYEMPLFDEDCSCFDPQYHQFIEAFLRALSKHMKEIFPDISVTLQPTDGFSPAFTEDYLEIRKLISKSISGVRILDPVSEHSLLEQNPFGTTVISINDTEAFSDLPLIHSSVCPDPTEDSAVGNLFIAGSRQKIRDLSVLCFRHSISSIYDRGLYYAEPFGMYPDGALSLCYPEAGRPVPSARLKQLKYTLQDFRALQLLRRYTSRERVLSLIQKSKNVSEFRDAVNRLLADKVQ